MPEWYLVIGLLGALSLLGLSWQPLLWTTPLLLAAIAALVAQAILSATKTKFPTHHPRRMDRLKLYGLTAVLHLMQPMARLIGRLRHGLSPLRARTRPDSHTRVKRQTTLWSETWRAHETWVEDLRFALGSRKILILTGGDFDAWDLEILGGLLASARVLVAIEEHGAGRQLVRYRISPNLSLWGMWTFVLLAALSVGAASDHAWVASAVLALSATALALRAMIENRSAASVASEVIAVQGPGSVK